MAGRREVLPNDNKRFSISVTILPTRPLPNGSVARVSEVCPITTKFNKHDSVNVRYNTLTMFARLSNNLFA